MSKTANQPEYPLSSVTVNDDRGRVNLVIEVTDEMRLSYAMAHGRPFPPGIDFVPQRDRQGRQMQEKVDRPVTYEGKGLQVAIKRARRWIKSGKRGTPPAHIVLALMAFLKADPQQFQHFAAEHAPA